MCRNFGDVAISKVEGWVVWECDEEGDAMVVDGCKAVYW